ncbi:LuxR C-terminal-related transcriptional regulator [Streptomyces sp. NBC_01431]|uniref:LuxR C-terminal-related transcriptional regulator n=1 Tax=Streptomyces sp. NBC_01431 TaxID=2903863 RepID=UPI002E31111C|nr:LuxR C-terminal-related transcriptional regulator [Streptomyces sp. NBC_01431]
MEPRTSRSTPRTGTAPEALSLAAELVRAPMERLLPLLSDAVAPLVPHTLAAELSPYCAHSPFKAHGRTEAAPAGRVTVPELRTIAAAVVPGRPWAGTAVIGGEERAVVAVVSEAAPMSSRLPVLVLVGEPAPAPAGGSARPSPGGRGTRVRGGGESPGERGALMRGGVRESAGGGLAVEDAEVVQQLWDLVTGHRARIASEGVPGPLAQSRATAAERARVIAELGEAYEAALTGLLGVLRGKDLDDRTARARAVELAVSALVELRADADRDQELAEEPAGEAFTRLADSLEPLLRHNEVRLEFAPPTAQDADTPVPADVAHIARAAVRAVVLAMAGQQGVRRIHVRWRLDGCQLVAAVRDDGPGELPREALGSHRVTQRVAALGGTLAVDALPGWGTTVTATLPLGTSPSPRADPLAGLHPREAEVLGHLARGHRNRTIAQELHISESTVKFHVANILAKLGVSSRGEAAALLHTVA